ncbi:MAG: stage 0 sporulation family protein [Deltaproteobacteria bacterium]|nr:stage 0 sporulation family protein [Deltaproteobacteria bacterium]
MKNTVGIKFKKEGKIYTFDAADIPLEKNDQVVVNTDSGPAIGTVVTGVKSVPPEKLPANLKIVVRKTTDADLKARENNQRLEQNARQFCKERIRERNLPMKLIELEVAFDRSKIVFYFSAENRVDFRELVKDLVQRFKTRIELRQIGARHEARIVKGLGICGREVCCASLLHNLDRVSVKMAKEQSMSLNPEKISGLCGRLMCCLAYEYDAYIDMKKNAAKCCGKQNQNDGCCAKTAKQKTPPAETTAKQKKGNNHATRAQNH